MVIVTLYGGCRLLEADVVEPGKGSTADVFDRVVRDQELLLHTDKEGRSATATLQPSLDLPVVLQVALRSHHSPGLLHSA